MNRGVVAPKAQKFFDLCYSLVNSGWHFETQARFFAMTCGNPENANSLINKCKIKDLLLNKWKFC